MNEAGLYYARLQLIQERGSSLQKIGQLQCRVNATETQSSLYESGQLTGTRDVYTCHQEWKEPISWYT